MADRPGRRHRASLLTGGVLLLVAALSGRMVLGARQELASAEQAAARHDPEAQGRHLRRAMAHYLPASPYVRLAKEQLESLAQAARAQGQPQRALDLYHQLRSAILHLRTPAHQPFSTDLPRINDAIATLQRAAPGAAQHLQTPAGQAAARQRLARPPDPRQPWAALGLIGFLGWVSAAGGLIARGLRPDGAVVLRRFYPLLGAAAAGQVAFWVGMALA